MAESIDTYIAVIHRVVGSLREEGVTEQNKREVAEAVYAIALSLGALKHKERTGCYPIATQLGSTSRDHAGRADGRKRISVRSCWTSLDG